MAKYIKFLKKAGLVPTNKQYKQIMTFMGFVLFLSIIALSFYGMWKYPVPYHYYEPTVLYKHIAHDIDECECGNDPECWKWWEGEVYV